MWMIPSAQLGRSLREGVMQSRAEVCDTECKLNLKNKVGFFWTKSADLRCSFDKNTMNLLLDFIFPQVNRRVITGSIRTTSASTPRCYAPAHPFRSASEPTCSPGRPTTHFRKQSFHFSAFLFSNLLKRLVRSKWTPTVFRTSRIS